jgi:dTDP-4-amino-4,6-dideoxygalactose transaminase
VTPPGVPRRNSTQSAVPVGGAETFFIGKTASRPDQYRRLFHPYPSARSALRAFLRASGFGRGATILLPAYIGWSPREGSGVLDPILELECEVDFYRVDERLRVDVEDYERRARRAGLGATVIIHYFGVVDPAYASLVAAARRSGLLVVEDEAHALYSDLVGASCGRAGDAAVFSLHKMLPVPHGGLLVLPRFRAHAWTEPVDPTLLPLVSLVTEYDLALIAARRRSNEDALRGVLEEVGDKVEPLWPSTPAGMVPQTVPVLVRGGRVVRDRLYFGLNEMGYGVVSLYHSLVPQIRREEFPDSHTVSDHILNLPVHQDVDPIDFAGLGEALRKL